MTGPAQAGATKDSEKADPPRPAPSVADVPGNTSQRTRLVCPTCAASVTVYVRTAKATCSHGGRHLARRTSRMLEVPV